MILLDTHAFVWLVSSPEELSAKAYEEVERGLGDLAISIVSVWEIALLVKKGRLHLPLPVDEFVDLALKHHGIVELPLSREVILDAVELEPIHNDSFDRILVAEARRNDATIITKDRAISQYPVKVVW